MPHHRSAKWVFHPSRRQLLIGAGALVLVLVVVTASSDRLPPGGDAAGRRPVSLKVTKATDFDPGG